MQTMQNDTMQRLQEQLDTGWAEIQDTITARSMRGNKNLERGQQFLTQIAAPTCLLIRHYLEQKGMAAQHVTTSTKCELHVEARGRSIRWNLYVNVSPEGTSLEYRAIVVRNGERIQLGGPLAPEKENAGVDEVTPDDIIDAFLECLWAFENPEAAGLSRLG